MSKIICIIDGMSDNSFKPSDYKYLSEMNLDHYQDTCLGLPPETLTCILHILGVKKVPKYLRGYVEALGAQISVQEEDLILRGSWYSLDEKGNCKAPCKAQITSEQRISLEGKEIDCIYYPIGDYRSVIVFPGKAKEINKLKTFPPSGGLGQSKRPEGCDIVDKAFDYFKTDDYCLVPWGESIVTEVSCENADIKEKAVISGTTIVKGIARLLGMQLIEVEGITGDVDTNLEEKVAKALETAKKCDSVILHINGADEASHRKNPQEKKAFLKKVDEVVLSRLLASDNEIVVVSDHGTNPVTGAHTGELQPVFVKM